MELIFEIILEIILEGSLELGTEKKVPMPLRILALLVLIGVYGGLIVLFVWMGLDAIDTKPAVGWLLMIVAAGLAILVICAIRKKWREKKQ